MKLSIVTTLYCSELHLAEFCQRVAKAARLLVGEDYELILVNDGSPDNSLGIALNLSGKDEHIVIVDLSRNFGHHKAMMCGLEYAIGDKVFLIDCDLEESPEWLHEFDKKLSQLDCDVVYGVQQQRRGNMVARAQGRLFYKLFRFITRVDQPDNIVTARLMSKRYVNALLQHQEYEINIGGLWVTTGFKQQPIAVNKTVSSETTYSFAKKISHLVNAVTSFSSAPLVLTFYIGLTICLFSAIFVISLLINYFLFARPVDGFTSVIASIWLLSGLVILLLGVQGIYLSKIFSEVKRRPNTIVKRVYRHAKHG